MIKNLFKQLVPSFLLSFYHFSLALTGAILYRFPSRKLKVIGVTGTNGKSTTVFLITKILEEAGFKTASLSSISFKIAGKEWPNTLKMTMPGRFKLQKFLRQAVDAGCQHAVLEVTSEGIKQHRHKFINFDTAVFTNLTPEHIESHGSFERYRQAKGKLFQAAKNIHIINLDDQNAEYFWQFPAKKKIGYQILGGRTSIKFNGVNGGQTSIIIDLNLRLLGKFNLYNAAAAICVGLSQGIDLETCKKAVEKVESIPGRMEVVYPVRKSHSSRQVGGRGDLPPNYSLSNGVYREQFSVIVDYAHTPDSLEKVYQTIQGRKICVLGAAGGGRDKWKRPEMGKIAAQYCDEIILTNEDPYDEDPEKIIEDIESGLTYFKRSPKKCYMKILDRKEAIKKALSLAGGGDTVIITGKGCEPWMCVANNKKIPWSDKQIVLDILKGIL